MLLKIFAVDIFGANISISTTAFLGAGAKFARVEKYFHHMRFFSTVVFLVVIFIITFAVSTTDFLVAGVPFARTDVIFSLSKIIFYCNFLRSKSFFL